MKRSVRIVQYIGFSVVHFEPYFYNNFGKCRPLSIILSPLHSEMNCSGRTDTEFTDFKHRTVSVLQHNLMPVESISNIGNCIYQISSVILA